MKGEQQNSETETQKKAARDSADRSARADADPDPLGIKDGRSTVLQAVLYRVWLYNSMPQPISDVQGDFVVDENGEYAFEEYKGVVVEIPGFLDEGWVIIDTAQWVPVEPNE